MRPPCGLLGLEAVDSSSSSSLPLSFFLSLPLPLSLSLFLSLSLSFPLSLSLSFSLSLSPSFRFSLPLFLPPPLCLSPSLCPSLSSSLPPPFPAESRRSFTALLPLLLFKTRFRSVSAASAMFRAGSRKPGHTPVIHLAASAMFHATCDCAIWAASRAEKRRSCVSIISSSSISNIMIIGPRNEKWSSRNEALAKTAKRKQETNNHKRNGQAVLRRNGKRPKRTGQPP